VLEQAEQLPFVADGLVALLGEDAACGGKYTALDISFIANSSPDFFSRTL
jgi:hypothetical protein